MMTAAWGITRDVIRAAISLGGDSDTLAAIPGGLGWRDAVSPDTEI